MVFSDESETWTSYDDYSSYDDDDEELQSQIELIQEQMSQRNRFNLTRTLQLNASTLTRKHTSDQLPVDLRQTGLNENPIYYSYVRFKVEFITCVEMFTS